MVEVVVVEMAGAGEIIRVSNSRVRRGSAVGFMMLWAWD